MPKLNGIFCRLALLLILAGCKQDSPKPIDPVKEEPTILDSVNMLFKDVYLWNNLIDQSLDANAFENRADSENSLRSYIDAMATAQSGTCNYSNPRRSQKKPHISVRLFL